MSRWVATIQDKILMNIHLHCARTIEQSIGQTTVLLTKNMCLNKLHYTWTFLECSNLFSVWQCMFFLFLLPSQHVSKNEVKKKQRQQLETQKIHPPQEKKEHFQFLPLIRLWYGSDTALIRPWYAPDTALIRPKFSKKKCKKNVKLFWKNMSQKKSGIKSITDRITNWF